MKYLPLCPRKWGIKNKVIAMIAGKEGPGGCCLSQARTRTIRCAEFCQALRNILGIHVSQPTELTEPILKEKDQHLL